MFTFSLSSFLIGSLAAFLIGVSKTGVPGLGIGSVVLMVYAFPGIEKQSTGAVLPLLILGDLFGVFFHSRDVQWKRLGNLFPPVFLGLILGALVLQELDDRQFMMLLGGAILLLLLFETVRSRMGWDKIPQSRFFTWLMGGASGFTTLIGNAAGPVMSIYMSAQKLSKERFMGTWVWFFLCVNLSKVPFMLGWVFPDLKMITPYTLRFDVLLVPSIILGALLGRRIYSLIPEKHFASLVLLLNIIPPLDMVLRPLLRALFK